MLQTAWDVPPVQYDISTSVQFVCMKFPGCLWTIAAWLVIPHCMWSLFIFLRCSMLYISSALFPSYLSLHYLVCLGLSVLVLFPSGTQGFISCATFINIPFFSTIYKNNSKNRSFSRRTALDRALHSDRELLITTFQVQFFYWFTPLLSASCFSSLFVRMSHQKN